MNRQVLITLADGRQVAVMLNGDHIRVMTRPSLGGGWGLPFDEAPTPHQPGTTFVGEW